MKYKRLLSLNTLLEKKSFFLLGPRSTGKSYLIDEQLSEHACIIDLLDSEYYFRLSESPSLLEAIVKENDKQIVVIDEIQKLPFR